MTTTYINAARRAKITCDALESLEDNHPEIFNTLRNCVDNWARGIRKEEPLFIHDKATNSVYDFCLMVDADVEVWWSECEHLDLLGEYQDLSQEELKGLKDLDDKFVTLNKKRMYVPNGMEIFTQMEQALLGFGFMDLVYDVVFTRNIPELNTIAKDSIGNIYNHLFQWRPIKF